MASGHATYKAISPQLQALAFGIFSHDKLAVESFVQSKPSLTLYSFHVVSKKGEAKFCMYVVGIGVCLSPYRLLMNPV